MVLRFTHRSRCAVTTTSAVQSQPDLGICDIQSIFRRMQPRRLVVDTGTHAVLFAMQVLLAHEEPAVRAKVCNLLGNLCRHSAHCYPALLRQSILPRLLTRLSDPDKSTRKFACFAVGNASFHNDSVRLTTSRKFGFVLLCQSNRNGFLSMYAMPQAYADLRPGIPALVSLIAGPFRACCAALHAPNTYRRSSDGALTPVHTSNMSCLVCAPHLCRWHYFMTRKKRRARMLQGPSATWSEIRLY